MPATALEVSGDTDGTAQPGWRRIDPVPWAIGLVTVVARLAFAASGPTDWDSAQYLAGAARFDVTHGRPQPPGYWLYVASGHLLHVLTGVGNVRVMVGVAALASGAAAGLTALAGRELGGRVTGLVAGLAVASAPFAWFAGSVVATYSFDLLACPALLLFAWRARPGSNHGLWAVVTLGILTGFRQSTAEAFALLALVAVVAATRTVARAVTTVVAGVAAVAVWFVPMIALQPGGLTAWTRATRSEASGAARATSILDHAPLAHVNLGFFAAATAVVLAPSLALAVGALAALGVRRLVSGPRRGPVTRSPRPWYQGRVAVLAAAIVPPVALVALLQFAKTGYTLAYLPAAAIALALPVGALVRREPRRRGGPRATANGSRTWSPVWLVLVLVAVAGAVAVNTERFVAGTGVLPQRWVTTDTGLWLRQTRYEAPYGSTADTIRTADTIDAGLAALRGSFDPGSDVVVLDTLDTGGAYFRNAGWALPSARVALLQPDHYLYNELDGTLYYQPGPDVEVGPGGSVLLVASPMLPGLSTLVTEGFAYPVPLLRPIGDLRAYRLPAGTSILGTRVVTSAGPRPLGRGI